MRPGPAPASAPISAPQTRDLAGFCPVSHIVFRKPRGLLLGGRACPRRPARRAVGLRPVAGQIHWIATARLLAHRACSRRCIEKDGSLSSPALDGAFIVSVTSPRSMAGER